jgi:hypothetical protein
MNTASRVWDLSVQSRRGRLFLFGAGAAAAWLLGYTRPHVAAGYDLSHDGGARRGSECSYVHAQRP